MHDQTRLDESKEKDAAKSFESHAAFPGPISPRLVSVVDDESVGRAPKAPTR